MRIKILLVDDHAVIRDGLRMIIGSETDMVVVGEAPDGRDALALLEELDPDVIVMDIAMPKLNGIEATRLIRQRAPAVKVVILSMHHTQEHLFQALRAGAQGYLLKESAGNEVVTAIRCVSTGKNYFGTGVEVPQEYLLAGDDLPPKSPLDTLSRREREILQHVVEGKTSLEISRLIGLSTKSVETYRSRLMLKLRINNIPTLVKFALNHGITTTD